MPLDRLRTAWCRDRGCSFLSADLASSPSHWDHHTVFEEPQDGGWLRAPTLESTEWGIRSCATYDLG